MNTLSPKFLKELEDRTVDECMEIVVYLLDALVVDGETYGDIPVEKPEEFVPFYLDLQSRGVTATLSVVNPKLAAQWERKFRRDAAAMMGLRT